MFKLRPVWLTALDDRSPQQSKLIAIDKDRGPLGGSRSPRKFATGQATSSPLCERGTWTPTAAWLSRHSARWACLRNDVAGTLRWRVDYGRTHLGRRPAVSWKGSGQFADHLERSARPWSIPMPIPS